MSRLPQVTARELVLFLKAHGFVDEKNGAQDDAYLKREVSPYCYRFTRVIGSALPGQNGGRSRPSKREGCFASRRFEA
jgi:hypothetical protein